MVASVLLVRPLIELYQNVNESKLERLSKNDLAFNRTILECKSVVKVNQDPMSVAFNRTILECKF